MKCQVHQYSREKLGDKVIYKCSKCPSYIFSPLHLGRETICPGCSRVFKLSTKHTQRKPHCGCLTKVYKEKYKLHINDSSSPTETIKDELLNMLLRKVGT